MFSDFIGGLLLIYVLVMVYCGINTAGSGSWLRYASRERLRFQTPARECCFLLMLVLFIVATYALIASDPRIVAAKDRPVLVLLGILVFGSAVLMLWLGGLQRLEIDLRRRRYHHTRRWLFFLLVSAHSGSLDEMSGVYCTKKGMVLLIFKNRRARLYGYTLGRFMSSRRWAEGLTRYVADALSLPVLQRELPLI